MSIQAITAMTTFATMLAAFLVAHDLADHVLGQTHWQAINKGAPSPEDIAAGAHPQQGWGACLAHVALYHLVMAAMVTLVWLVLPLHLSWAGLCAALACSAITHSILDRRWPVRWLLQRTGSAGFAELATGGMNGMYLTDQALHRTALLVSALLVAVL